MLPLVWSRALTSMSAPFTSKGAETTSIAPPRSCTSTEKRLVLEAPILNDLWQQGDRLPDQTGLIESRSPGLKVIFRKCPLYFRYDAGSVLSHAR